ncbi:MULTISPECIES: response regulator transcription factor [Fusobacterium]|uniref:response regulator transcription factor n=1 Tax=Fusobacterium TaxID=848 RepID=UPI001476896B|nr:MULTISPECIES: response regulator transcription factor [Fusobacterium]NME35304.1 response regulator transcription factor [Fusobacterium sp. FSA-380-WT-3A]
MAKILVVEDDLEIQQLITYFFEKENHKVDKIDDGLKALKILKKEKSDVVILDLMLPGIDGKSFTKIVKSLPEEYGNPKIIMVTAKTEIEDVLEGLEIGADDYLKKPFDPRELVLRVKKLLKDEKKEQKEENLYNFLDMEINVDTHMVLVNGEEIELSKKEYDLLLLLVRNKGLVVTREKILDEVWNSNYYTGDRTVDVYISKLREKIPLLSDSIHTVKGVGYKLKEKK